MLLFYLIYTDSKDRRIEGDFFVKPIVANDLFDAQEQAKGFCVGGKTQWGLNYIEEVK